MLLLELFFYDMYAGVIIGQCYFEWCIIFAYETFFPGREKLKTVTFLVLNSKCDAMETWIYLKHFLFLMDLVSYL